MGWESLQWSDVKYLHHGTTFRAWSNIPAKGIIPGYKDNAQRGRKQYEEPRTEAFYSPSNYIRGAQPNPHTNVPPCKVKHWKKEVETVIDMYIATQSGCRFWLGAQGGIMTEDKVPSAAIVAIRRSKDDRDCGEQLWPVSAPRWEYPPLECRCTP
eukprot:5666115-Pyramimonas_sp.AAC.1